jgi:hypothetical protein
LNVVVVADISWQYIYGSFKIKNAAIIGEMVEIRARDSIIMITLT